MGSLHLYEGVLPAIRMLRECTNRLETSALIDGNRATIERGDSQGASRNGILLCGEAQASIEKIMPMPKTGQVWP